MGGEPPDGASPLPICCGSALAPNCMLVWPLCMQEPEINNSIKMEVGIEDCLHIEFEYDKSK